MKAPRCFCWLPLLLSLALMSCASVAKAPPGLPSSPDTADAQAQLRGYISAEMKRLAIPGLSIAVVDASGSLWTEGFGRADRDGRPFTAATVSNIGSVSKLFTAIAIMRLAEQGRLELDAPVSRYLPDFQPASFGPDPAGVTIRGLLTHESGLQSDYLDGFMPDSSIKEQGLRPYAEVARLASRTTLVHEANTVFAYSNLGYSLLGLVVEAVSGQNFNDFVRAEVTLPLGMADASFEYRAEAAERYARGQKGRGWVDIPAIRDQPAGSLATSAREMALFISAVLQARSGTQPPAGYSLLGQAAMREMWRTQNAAVARDFGFQIGLAWWPTRLGQIPDELFYGHGGDLPPFHAMLIIDPERELGVCIMVNGGKNLSSFTLSDIATRAIESFGLARGAPAMQRQPLVAELPAQPTPAADLATLPGNYASPMGLIEVRQRGKALQAKVNGVWIDMEYKGGQRYALQAKMLGIPLPIAALRELAIRSASVDGTPYLILEMLGLPMGPAQRIEALETDPAWLARAGVWTAGDKEQPMLKSLELKLDKTTGLFVAVGNTGAGAPLILPVATRGPDQAWLRGYGRNLGSAIRVYREEGQEYLETMGLRFVKK